MPSVAQPSASPRTACWNCHITLGSSGEPKFRQLVTAFGVAPVVSDIAECLGQRELRAGVRVELGVAARRVGRQRDSASGFLVDADHAGVGMLGEHRVAAHVAVVLLGDPAATAQLAGWRAS